MSKESKNIIKLDFEDNIKYSEFEILMDKQWVEHRIKSVKTSKPFLDKINNLKEFQDKEKDFNPFTGKSMGIYNWKKKIKHPVVYSYNDIKIEIDEEVKDNRVLLILENEDEN